MLADERAGVGSISDTGTNRITGKTYINMTAADSSGLCHLGLEGPPGFKEQPRGPSSLRRT